MPKPELTYKKIREAAQRTGVDDLNLAGLIDTYLQVKNGLGGKRTKKELRELEGKIRAGGIGPKAINDTHYEK